MYIFFIFFFRLAIVFLVEIVTVEKLGEVRLLKFRWGRFFSEGFEEGELYDGVCFRIRYDYYVEKYIRFVKSMGYIWGSRVGGVIGRN